MYGVKSASIGGIVASNVIHLPRPAAERPARPRLAHYLRVGRNDHKQVIDVLAEGELGYQGVVIEALYASRHRELIEAALQRGLDVISDPRSQASAMPGGYSEAIEKLPWGLDRPHRLDDFTGDAGRQKALQWAEFATKHHSTVAVALTHLIQSKNDPWLGVDVANVGVLRDALPAEVPVIYSLALPMALFRDPTERLAIISALKDAPMDALWLKVENFGANETGAKVQDYIFACADFHALNVPLVADHVAGLPGLGLMAFGATGGIAHGVQALESFRVSHWRRQPKERDGGSSGAPPRRIYCRELGIMLKKNEADALINYSSRTRGQFGCKDPHCCPGGISDMFEQPIRHYLRQRAREVDGLDAIPASARPNRYMEDMVRKTSDMTASAAALAIGNNELASRLQDQQQKMGRFRGAMAHLAETFVPQSISEQPPTRAQREGRA